MQLLHKHGQILLHRCKIVTNMHFICNAGYAANRQDPEISAVSAGFRLLRRRYGPVITQMASSFLNYTYNLRSGLRYSSARRCRRIIIPKWRKTPTNAPLHIYCPTTNFAIVPTTYLTLATMITARQSTTTTKHPITFLTTTTLMATDLVIILIKLGAQLKGLKIYPNQSYY